MKKGILWVAVLFLFILLRVRAFSKNVKSSSKFDYSDDSLAFSMEDGNFRYFFKENGNILVGARDRVVSLPIKDVKKLRDIIKWPVPSCHKSKDNFCANYVLFLSSKTKQPNHMGGAPLGRKSEASEYRVCGTYGKATGCQTFRWNMQKKLFTAIEDTVETGGSVVPNDPYLSYIYSQEGNQLYIASLSRQSQAPFLIRQDGHSLVSTPIRGSQELFNGQRHVKFHQFLPFLQQEYLIFTEIALEPLNRNSIQPQQRYQPIYTRIMRVCKQDRGYRNPFTRDTFHLFSSLFKARLLCSQPALTDEDTGQTKIGEADLDFDRLLAVTPSHSGETATSALTGEVGTFIGLFSTNHNTKRGPVQLAMCAFTAGEVERVFSQSDFMRKKKEGHNRFWERVPRTNLRNVTECPGTPDSFRASEKHPMLLSPVRPWRGEPFHLLTAHYRPTTLAVQWNVNHARFRRSNSSPMDLLYLGTDRGSVLKLLLIPNKPPHLIETLIVFGKSTTVTRIIVGEKEGHIVVMSDNAIKSIPMNRCSSRNSCVKCVAFRDPNCFWDPQTRQCSSDQLGYNNVLTGFHTVCSSDVRLNRTTGLFPILPKVHKPAASLGKARPSPGVSSTVFGLTICILLATVIVLGSILLVLCFGPKRWRKWRFGSRRLRRAHSLEDHSPGMGTTKLNNLKDHSLRLGSVANEYQEMPHAPPMMDPSRVPLNQHLNVLPSTDEEKSPVYAEPIHRGDLVPSTADSGRSAKFFSSRGSLPPPPYT